MRVESTHNNKGKEVDAFGRAMFGRDFTSGSSTMMVVEVNGYVVPFIADWTGYCTKMMRKSNQKLQPLMFFSAM